MNADGSGVIQLTASDFMSDGWPVWSPDGARILFSSTFCDVDCTFVLSTMKPDGSDVRQVTSGFVSDIDGVWSPDGRKIAFSAQHSGMVTIVNADGSNRLELVFGHSATWRR
jgi:Tol biopolymer transport system component